MGLPQRGVLIRLFIYVPLIGFLGWRAMQGRCGADEPTIEAEPSLRDELAPYRKTITLPDGSQQEIVELTPEQAEAVLGHKIPAAPPKPEAEPEPTKGEAEPEAEPEPTKGDTDPSGNTDPGSTAETESAAPLGSDDGSGTSDRASAGAASTTD